MGFGTYKNGRSSGTIRAKTVFWDPSRIKVKNQGLSWRIQDSWLLCHNSPSATLGLMMVDSKVLSSGTTAQWIYYRKE